MSVVHLTLNLSNEVVGAVHLSDQSPLPTAMNEYFIVPTTTPTVEGGFEVIEYSLVHRTLVAPVKVLEQREREVVKPLEGDK
ncbi:hypothetical protein [Rhodococcus aetherivorans]|uniref:hypothetical protein n=1 Tax=Rhodococcus aetherivorans TaxID=191292 RepID=UPI003890E4C9